MQRRDFLKLTSSALLGPIVGGQFTQSVLAAQLTANTSTIMQTKSNSSQMPVLILIELSGGNDSHNTVIDLNQLSAYQALRPNLGLSKNERSKLDNRFALHHSLADFITPWAQGELALVHGLGYPQPNKSHFRSIEIWDMASTANEHGSSGWLANILADISKNPIDALTFGRNSTVFSGGTSTHVQLNNLSSYFKNINNWDNHTQGKSNSALRHLLTLGKDIEASKALLMQGLTKKINIKTQFPKTKFSRQLADVAKVIRMDLQIPAFKVAIGSFDTHVGQKNKHQKLLKDLADGMLALREELQLSGHWPNVLMMTYSEFGRRAAQNNSGGSDHGTAASHFLMSGRVKGGHYGSYPDLSALVNRDVTFNTDFKALYQSVVRQWWEQPNFTIAAGLAPLDILHRS